MKTPLLFSIMLLVLGMGYSQSTTKTFQHDDKTYLYEDFNEVTQPKALLVLFNGGSGIASSIPRESSLADSAVNYQIKTIGIDQSELYLTDSTYQHIREIIMHVMSENSIEDNLFIGGFSLGGFTSIRLSEMAAEQKDAIMIPNAIFAIDPPLDHLELRNYCLRELDRECFNEDANRLGKGEANWILDYYQRNFGPLEQDSSSYINHSCFTASSSNGGNARFLNAVPVKMVHEIDIMWLIEERCRDLSDANVLVSSKFIKYLYNHGNKDATITLTTNKGYRSDGRRHPHSWSIAEPIPTLDWLMKYLK